MEQVALDFVPGETGLAELSRGAWVTPRERGVSRLWKPGRCKAGNAGRRRPDDTRHLILVEVLDGGAEGTAHEAVGRIWVVQEADLQGDEPILQRQGLHDLVALPVPHVDVASIQPWGRDGAREWAQDQGSGWRVKAREQTRAKC